MNNPASNVRPSRLVSANLLWALAFLVPITIIVGVAWPRTLGAQNELRLDRSSLAVTSQTSTTVGFGAIDTASISYSGSVDGTNAGTLAASAQGSAPDTPDQPTGAAVFIGGVDLEWNDVPEADSYDVQLYRNGQWIDLPGNGVEIAFYGAGAIISGLDPGSSLWFQVRARNARGSSDWSNFISLPSTNQFEAGRRARPDNVTASGAPSVNGTPQVGETLTADTTGIEDENGLDRVQYRFQWVSNDGSADTDIPGATDSTYTLTINDEGKTIKVRVAFTDRGGYAELLTRSATAVVGPFSHRVATGAPVITGTAQVGNSLTADTSNIADSDGLANVSYSYQWISNHGSSDTDIEGATGSSYTLVAGDEGNTIKVRVSFTDDAGNDESLTSAATAAVNFAVQQQITNSAATGLPVITGTAHVGETLTANTSGISDSDGLTSVSYSYQWISNDGTSDADIVGATGSTYVPVAADEGKAIKLSVSFTDDAGNDETLTSAATGAVAPSPLTVTLENNPSSHNGTDAFTFRIQFSEETSLSFRTLRDQAFTVAGGTVKKAKRKVKGSNLGWTIHVEPDSNSDVEIVLPPTTDCASTGAICTQDGRKLSNQLGFTVRGPNQ